MKDHRSDIITVLGTLTLVLGWTAVAGAAGGGGASGQRRGAQGLLLALP